MCYQKINYSHFHYTTLLHMPIPTFPKHDYSRTQINHENLIKHFCSIFYFHLGHPAVLYRPILQGSYQSHIAQQFKSFKRRVIQLHVSANEWSFLEHYLLPVISLQYGQTELTTIRCYNTGSTVRYNKTNISQCASYNSNHHVKYIITVPSILMKDLILKFSLATSIGSSTSSYRNSCLFVCFDELLSVLILYLIYLQCL